ncbi:MAG: methenyltetrahydromethanopterin cyclohydrolase [Candidatus Bathyarchaeota archaeon]|jgi:methenyltetrahydromethanopterin cyclohydrolase|nr:methenyltetrahydromethanopterin cyclohydrolase [Candidatus Bathyarchaeota archaeon]
MLQGTLNTNAWELVTRFRKQPDLFGVQVSESNQGAQIIDVGVNTKGGFDAGSLVTEICLGGYGQAYIRFQQYGRNTLPTIQVSTDHPVVATLASQLAGWRITVGSYHAIASGPARALARKPKKLFSKIQYSEIAEKAVIVLEASEIPTEEAISFIASTCGISIEHLCVIVAPTNSVAGLTQISGRIVETAIHKLMELGFDPNRVCYGIGSAPIAPLAHDEADAMGRANDMLLYGGVAYLTVDWTSDNRELMDIVHQVPSVMSSDYGRPFAEIFASVDGDFYKLDPHLFAPAVIVVNDIASGETYRAGYVNNEVIEESIRFRNLL